MPPMRTHFLSTASNLDHLFFLTSGHHILRYHRLRRNRLRAQLRQIDALLEGAQASQVVNNRDADETLVFVGVQFDFEVLNPPRRAITI